MTTTNAQVGLGLKFSYETTPGSGVFSDAVEVLSATPPAQKLDAVEVTHMQSPGGFKEYIAGLIDAGDVQIEISHAPQSQTDTDLISWQVAREKRQVKLTWANTHSITCYAVPTDYAPAAVTPDGLQKATFTGKLSGQPSHA